MTIEHLTDWHAVERFLLVWDHVRLKQLRVAALVEQFRVVAVRQQFDVAYAGTVAPLNSLSIRRLWRRLAGRSTWLNGWWEFSLAQAGQNKTKRNWNIPNGVVQGGTGQSFWWSDNFSTTVFLIFTDNGASIRFDIFDFLYQPGWFNSQVHRKKHPLKDAWWASQQSTAILKNNPQLKKF